jgi:cytochrome c oxidase subunit III
MAQGEVKHDYHLVDPSPWPVVGALGVFLMMIGAAFWLNKTYAGFGVLAGIPWIFAIGLALVLYTMAGWWRDVITESVVEGAHAPVVKLSLRYGMVLFIVSEAMFFAAWFWAWFNFALFPYDTALTGWPPAGIVPLDPWQLPLLGTVILLTSGTTVTWAHHAIQTGNKRGAILALSLTVILGVSFTVLLATACAQAPFSFGFKGAALTAFTDPAHTSLAAGQGNLGAIYGSIFFMANGILGIHVAAGTVFLAVCLGRAIRGHFTPTRHFGFEAAAWFWHFVIVIWLILFVAVYVFGRG